MLDVTRLRVLVAVARCGSVTAAARALNYAQPSVSHHLARLEAETGTKLIQRAGRGIRLTDAGRLLAERAAEVIGRLDAAENELAAYTGLRAGRLRLAAFPSALGTIVPAAGAMLREHQPGVDLRLTEAEPPEALRMLRAGYVDVALVFRYSPDPDGMAAGRDGESTDDESGIDLDEGLREKLLLDEPVHLVTSASAHPGPGGAEPPAELTSYARHRWIAGCDRCRANLLRQCALAGFTPKIAFTTDDYVAVQALVAADLGVSTLPALCLRAARHPGIRTVPLPGARRYVFAVRYGDPPGPELLAPDGVAGEDAELAAVAAELRGLDEDGSLMAAAIRGALDMLLDGQHTGRYRWDQLHKTEKTHAGTLVEIGLQREFGFTDGAVLDYLIAGAEIDCKFSQRLGGWMIPPEAFGMLLLLLSASDEHGRWYAGLVRAREQHLRAAANRDLKRALNDSGVGTIRWLHRRARLVRFGILNGCRGGRARVWLDGAEWVVAEPADPVAPAPARVHD